MTLADRLAYDLDRALSPSVHLTQVRTVEDARDLDVPTAATMLVVACGETLGDGLGGLFEWVPESVTVDDDGVSSIAITGNVTGRFIRTQATTDGIADSSVTTAKIASEAVTDAKVSTTGGLGTYLRTVTRITSSASVSSIVSAATAMAGVGEVVLGPGSYTVNAAINFSSLSNLVVNCHPNAAFVASLTNGTGQTNSPFFATPTLGATANLTGSVTVGSTRIDIDSTASFTVGSVIAVGFGNRFSYYTVKARSTSSGAGYLTVERPILWAFTSSDDVWLVTAQSKRLRIYGNGASISGTGDRAFELTGVQDCVVEGFTIDASSGFGGIVAAFDIGGLRNTFRDIHILGGYGAQGGIALESNEGSLIDHCSVTKVTSALANPGIFLADDMDCHVRHSRSELNVVGLEFNYGGSPGEGSKRCSVFGSLFAGNTSHGLQVLNGSAEVQVESTQCRYNGGNGVYIANNSTGVQLVAVNASDNTGSGVQATSGSSFSIVSGVLKNNGACGVDTGADMIALGCDVANNLASAGLQVTGSASARITGCKIAARSDSTYSDGIMMSSTGSMLVSDCTFDLSGGGTKVAIEHNAAGVVQVVNSKVTAAGSHGYYTNTGTAKLRRGSNVDFSMATTPWTVQIANFGTATLSGGTVTTSNTMITAADRLRLTRKTDAGANTGHLAYSISASTSHTITSTNGSDNGTVDWEF